MCDDVLIVTKLQPEVMPVHHETSHETFKAEPLIEQFGLLYQWFV
jgi:hypothetical protein